MKTRNKKMTKRRRKLVKWRYEVNIKIMRNVVEIVH